MDDVYNLRHGMAVMTSMNALHTDILADQYHADPCPDPSLSRSVAKLLIERTPQHAFIAHPRLSPVDVRPSPDRFNIGTVGHHLILGKGGDYVEVEADDWRTKDAKAKRDEIAASGQTPILSHQLATAREMADAVADQLPAFGLGDLFRTGTPEVVGLWDDPVAGHCRFMTDLVSDEGAMWDIKTTSIPLSLETAGRQCAQLGYEFQAAFYERGLVAIKPEMAGRVEFNILFVEISAPFAILPVRLPNDAMAKGRFNVDRACRLWAECKKLRQWPMYSGGILTVEYPPWQVGEWAEYQEGNDVV